MALVLRELSDEEMRQILAQPRVLKSEFFDKVDAWFEENKASLRERYGGMHLYVNARTLAFSVGKTHDIAANQHYGPARPDGSHFLCVYFKPLP